MTHGEIAKYFPVFIVDDEPRLLAVLAESVMTLGRPVQTFSSAHACLEAIQNGPCSLLISDVSMPEMDGLQLMTKVRAFKPLLPIIMVTGFGNVPLAVRALKDGALDFVEKPIDETTFLPKVEKALKRTANAHIDIQTLTDAERRILLLVGEGRSNKDIAEIVGRSVRTVENHRFRLMNKLQVDNVASLAELALAMKTLDDPSS